MGKTQRLQENAYLRAVLNTVLDGIITIDAEGTIQDINPAAVEIFGYPAQELVGQNVALLMPEPHHSRHDDYLARYWQTGERQIIGSGREVMARRKNGSTFPIALGVNEMEIDGERLFVGTVRDISAQKEAESRLKSYFEALQQSNQELDDFAYIASHDLKEPLRGLYNNALFVKEDCYDAIDPDSQRRLERMMLLCQRLERLIDDLLYFSRLGRQNLAVRPVDLNEVIDDLALRLATLLQENCATLSVPKPLPTVVCDVPRITEVFHNLIVNGIKYNDKKHRVVEIGVLQKPSSTAPSVDQPSQPQRIFYVKDNGIGIPREFHNDIFRLFKRLHCEPEQERGTGVGLTFVKKIIDRHQGRLWLESEIGTGTTFFFTLKKPRELGQ